MPWPKRKHTYYSCDILKEECMQVPMERGDVETPDCENCRVWERLVRERTHKNGR
jgi:hypothetical protein